MKNNRIGIPHANDSGMLCSFRYVLLSSMCLFTLLSSGGACKKTQTVFSEPPAQRERKEDSDNNESNSHIDDLGDAIADAKPTIAEVSTHFAGAIHVQSIDGNIVAQMPSGKWLQITTSRRDELPVLSHDRTRILFTRRLTKNTCPPPSEEDGCYPCWELWMISSGLQEVWLVGNEEASMKNTDRTGPWSGISPVTFSIDGETVYFSDSGVCTVGSMASWAYNLRTKQLVLLAPSSLIEREVLSGPYKGHVIVSRARLQAIGYDYVSELISKKGKKLFELPLEPAKQKAFLKEQESLEKSGQ